MGSGTEAIASIYTLILMELNSKVGSIMVKKCDGGGLSGIWKVVL